MKKLKFQKLGLLAMAMMSLLFVNCSENEDSNSGTSKLIVKLVDAPGDYDKVNIEILDVLIKSSTDTADEGWQSIGNPEMVGEGKIYDLLKLTGGANVIMTDSLIPSGRLGQIKLLLGDQNSVVVDGIKHNLETPSALQSGLKLQINQTLKSDITYNFLLDFNVDKSIVPTGTPGKYNLKPVIKASTEAASGIIKGAITPAVDFKVLATVKVGEDEITAYANAEGLFQLNGVPAGTYDVTLTPEITTGLAPKTIKNAVAVNGQTTNVAPVSLP